MSEINIRDEIEKIIEGWKKNELSGDSAMILVFNVLHPPIITQDEIDWAKGYKKEGPR